MSRTIGKEPKCEGCFVQPNFEARINDIVRYSKAAISNKVSMADHGVHQIVGAGGGICSPGWVELENGDRLSHAWLVLLGGATEAFEEATRLRKELDVLKKGKSGKRVRRKNK